MGQWVMWARGGVGGREGRPGGGGGGPGGKGGVVGGGGGRRAAPRHFGRSHPWPKSAAQTPRGTRRTALARGTSRSRCAEGEMASVTPRSPFHAPNHDIPTELLVMHCAQSANLLCARRQDSQGDKA